jgi:hypothetical protein
VTYTVPKGARAQRARPAAHWGGGRDQPGSAVKNLAYSGGYPAGLMVGFRATAASESVTADGKEILEARWFTRAELSQRAAAGRPLGRVDSIDRHLLRSWLDQPGTPPGRA